METSSRQQLGRYHRYILATLPDASEGADSTGGGSAKDNRGKEKTTGQTGGVNGSVNSYTTAVPFTTVLDELQQWMASLGLNPGAKNEKGLCEDGNFRWVYRARRKYVRSICASMFAVGDAAFTCLSPQRGDGSDLRSESGVATLVAEKARMKR